MSVANNLPPGYFGRLTEAFQKVFKAYPPKTLDSRLVYDIYDEWKKACAVGRRVDLDRLIAWCEERAGGRPARKAQAAAAVVPAKRSSRSRASSRAAPPASLLK